MCLALLLPLLAQAAQTVPPEDDFAPGLLIFALFGLLVLCVLVGIGLVVGLFCALGAAALAALGIVSTAALVGACQRRVSAGVRALHYQLCAAAGLPGGVGILWLGTELFQVAMSHREIVLTGAAAGVAAGLLFAFLADLAVRLIYRRVMLSAWLR